MNDIREQGLRDPATVLDGMLLDGRNRQRACLLVDVPLRTVDYTGDDPLAYIISTNLERRHLNPSQLAMVGARISTMKVGNPTFGNSANLPNKVSQPDAAARVNVSERSIRHAAVVLDKAEPEVVVAVDQGKIAVSVAASIASKPRDAQLGRLAREERKAEGTHRQKDDFYRTPVAATRALLEVERFPAMIWEPACGDGAISEVLTEAGHEVISTDLIDRGYGEGGVDFLEEAKKRANCVVTNPPFKLDDDFALHAMEIGVRKVALLCRLTWLEGSERHARLFNLGKLARVWVFSARQTLWYGDDQFPETDGGMTAYAWFIFERDHRGPPTLGWLAEEDA